MNDDGSIGPKVLEVSSLDREGPLVAVSLSFRDDRLDDEMLAALVRIHVLSALLEGAHDDAEHLVLDGRSTTRTTL